MRDPFEPLASMPNLGRTHLFMGHPLSNGVDKTCVEPGNAFSPGLWTVGIYPALLCEGELISPQTRELPFAFDSQPPVTVSRFAFHDASLTSRLAHIGGPLWHGTDFLFVRVEGRYDDAALVITGTGPAGGDIEGFEETSNGLRIKDGALLRFETPVRTAFSEDGRAAFVHFKGELRAVVLHGFKNRALFDIPHPGTPYTVEEGIRQARLGFDRALPAHIHTPDPRLNALWDMSAFHILSAMEDGLPRISVSNYPILWIRDCVMVLRALDLMGRHDLARTGCDYLKDKIFSGGFGAESDNPGEGLWCLCEHALLTGDQDWARSILPHVAERVRWIARMLHADTVVTLPADMRTVWAHWIIGTDIVCLPHEGNHIHGRMDGHSPDFYINAWAQTGLNRAARLAAFVGEDALRAEWQAMADALEKAVDTELLPAFGNERDACIAPYPSGLYADAPERFKKPFMDFFRANRLTEQGGRVSQRLWPYFEVAHIHNAMLLGERDAAWTCLDAFIDDPQWRGMAIFTESEYGWTEMLPFGTGKYGKGWLHEGALGGNMPHNWTSAEVMLLLRDMLLTEDKDGLTLLRGIPASMIKPGACFGADSLPTRFGPVSFRITFDDALTPAVTFDGVQPPYRLDLPE